MSNKNDFHALETAIQRCTALQAELNNKVSLDERGGRFMRTFELLDLLEQSLIQAAKAIKTAKK